MSKRSKGSHYDWHRDIGSTDNIAKARVNVAIVQLSDPGDYKGGVLQIKYEDQVIDINQKYYTLYREFVKTVKGVEKLNEAFPELKINIFDTLDKSSLSKICLITDGAVGESSPSIALPFTLA